MQWSHPRLAQGYLIVGGVNLHKFAAETGSTAGDVKECSVERARQFKYRIFISSPSLFGSEHHPTSPKSIQL